MGYVSQIILIGDSHPNNYGLQPNYLIEVWGDNIVFVCKQLSPGNTEIESKLKQFKVICKNPNDFTKDLFIAINKVLKSAVKNKLGCSDLAIVSFDSEKSDKVFLDALEKEFPKHGLYFFPLTDFKIWSHWGPDWVRGGAFK